MPFTATATQVMMAADGRLWLLLAHPDWPEVQAGEPVPVIPFEHVEAAPWPDQPDERFAG